MERVSSARQLFTNFSRISIESRRERLCSLLRLTPTKIIGRKIPSFQYYSTIREKRRKKDPTILLIHLSIELRSPNDSSRIIEPPVTRRNTPYTEMVGLPARALAFSSLRVRSHVYGACVRVRVLVHPRGSVVWESGMWRAVGREREEGGRAR